MNARNTVAERKRGGRNKSTVSVKEAKKTDRATEVQMEGEKNRQGAGNRYRNRWIDGGKETKCIGDSSRDRTREKEQEGPETSK